MRDRRSKQVSMTVTCHKDRTRFLLERYVIRPRSQTRESNEHVAFLSGNCRIQQEKGDLFGFEPWCRARSYGFQYRSQAAFCRLPVMPFISRACFGAGLGAGYIDRRYARPEMVVVSRLEIVTEFAIAMQMDAIRQETARTDTSRDVG